MRNYIKILVALYRLKRQAKLSARKMRALQEKKLRTMLHYAWGNSVYYRRTFEAAGITEEQLDELPLSCFPTMDKKLFLEHFDELVVPQDLRLCEVREFDAAENADRKPYKGKYHVVHSSGSTGKPGYFVYDEEAWNSMLVGMLRAALWNILLCGHLTSFSYVLLRLIRFCFFLPAALHNARNKKRLLLQGYVCNNIIISIQRTDNDIIKFRNMTQVENDNIR